MKGNTVYDLVAGLDLDFDSSALTADKPAAHILQRIRDLESRQESSPVPAPVGDSRQAGPEKDKRGPPTVAYGLDLKYWGQEDVVPGEIPKNNADCHRFWRPADEKCLAFTRIPYSRFLIQG